MEPVKETAKALFSIATELYGSKEIAIQEILRALQQPLPAGCVRLMRNPNPQCIRDKTFSVYPMEIS